MGSPNQGYQHIHELAGDLLVTPESEYKNIRCFLEFKCNMCGKLYNTTGFLYIKTINRRSCSDCAHKRRNDGSTRRDTFISKATKIHGGYYSYDTLPETFAAKDKITIVCPKHGNILTTQDQHINKKSGCKHCKIDKITNATRSNVVDFSVKANNIHNFKYTYDEVKYVNTKTLVTIKCVKHGPFELTPDLHLRGQGCPLCTSTTKPVLAIIEMLNLHNIAFTTEKQFLGCVGISGKPLRFDLYLPDRNMCIEYDGIHHFESIRFGNMSEQQAQERFLIQQQHDNIKDEYCETHNIHLIRIPYTTHHPDAFLRNILKGDMPPERFFYTWKDLSDDVQRVAQYIKSFNYDRFAIYGIARGGVVFSTCLSYHFDDISEYGVITFQRYDGNDKNVRFDIVHKTNDIPIFVIDDLISSGITMKKAVSALHHKFKKSKVHPIVIFGEQNKDDVFFIKEHPKQWIVFPYEV